MHSTHLNLGSLTLWFPSTARLLLASHCAVCYAEEESLVSLYDVHSVWVLQGSSVIALYSPSRLPSDILDPWNTECTLRSPVPLALTCVLC